MTAVAIAPTEIAVLIAFLPLSRIRIGGFSLLGCSTGVADGRRSKSCGPNGPEANREVAFSRLLSGLEQSTVMQQPMMQWFAQTVLLSLGVSFAQPSQMGVPGSIICRSRNYPDREIWLIMGILPSATPLQ
jgi:hypothetical protein